MNDNNSPFTVRAVRSLPFQCVALASAAALGVAISGSYSRAAAAAAGPDGRLRIATVDMQQVFKEYYKTNAAQADINNDRLGIQKELTDRDKRLSDLQTALGSMKKQLDDPSIAPARQQATYQEFQMKQQEGAAMQHERQDYIERTNKAVNEKMVLKMKSILEEIQGVIGDQAKSSEYDYVFDKSGLSTSQVPFLLYNKDAIDMTPELSKKLNENAPPAGQPAAPDKATPPAKPAGK